MKAIIIDDELHSRETTRMMLKSIAADVSIIGVADNAREGAIMILDKKPDIIFLDIQMPEINGIEMLNLIPSYTGEIIFITAFDRYAVEAFKKGALHYLLKPLDPNDLARAINRVKKNKKDNVFSAKGKWISLSTMEGWIVLKKEDILRCEAYKNYTTIKTKNSSYTISRTLKDVQKKLADTLFYRVHNSHIINIAFIDRVIKSDGGSVLMQNGDLIPISKNKKSSFFDWFQQHIEMI